MEKTQIKYPKFFNNLTLFATRPITLQREELAGYGFYKFCKVKTVGLPLESGNRVMYMDKLDKERCHKFIVSGMSSESGWQKHLEEYKKSFKILKNTSKLALCADKLSVKECGVIFQKWLDAFAGVSKFILAPFAVEHLVDPQCRILLKKEFGGAADIVFGMISSPSRLNEFQEMRLQILDKIIKGRIKINDFAALAQEYYWYTEYSWVEPFLDKRYFFKEAAKLTVKEAKTEKKEILQSVKKNKKEFQKLKRQIKNPKLKLLAEIIHLYAFLRTQRIDFFKRGQARIRNIYKKIARELTVITGNEWTNEMVVNCLNEELLDFMYKGKIPNIKLIKQRVAQQYIYYKEERPGVIYGAKQVNFIKNFIQKSQTKGDEQIKGMIAFNGKVKGRVTIVVSKKDLPKVKKGDILVAKTTMPDYAPAMKIAAAFVTEEGGVTSHAAIIARELKKPCIVATGNCTKLIHSGDLVEVDAERGKGVVKILSKK